MLVCIAQCQHQNQHQNQNKGTRTRWKTRDRTWITQSCGRSLWRQHAIDLGGIKVHVRAHCRLTIDPGDRGEQRSESTSWSLGSTAGTSAQQGRVADKTVGPSPSLSFDDTQPVQVLYQHLAPIPASQYISCRQSRIYMGQKLGGLVTPIG
jgi:hypothetical protein